MCVLWCVNECVTSVVDKLTTMNKCKPLFSLGCSLCGTQLARSPSQWLLVV